MSSPTVALRERPLLQVVSWLDEARASGEPEPDAMTLATATRDGRPSARIVLCRGVDDRGVRFFTNYESRKGTELGDNPYAAVVFHWAKLGRQVRIEGTVQRLPAADSDAYFRRRPRGHQLSAHASAQSRPVASLAVLHERMAEVTVEFEGRDVPRPAGWGGFLLVAGAIEFWTQGADRVHERIRFERTNGAWVDHRLAP